MKAVHKFWAFVLAFTIVSGIYAVLPAATDALAEAIYDGSGVISVPDVSFGEGSSTSGTEKGSPPSSHSDSQHHYSGETEKKKSKKPRGWQKKDGIWFFYVNGKPMQGWLNDDDSGKQYYLQPDGTMATGWLMIDGSWYYFDTGGAMETGLVKIDGATYYFHPDGNMATGWVELDGAMRYFARSSGKMFAYGDYIIGGKTYTFDANGICTNP